MHNDDVIFQVDDAAREGLLPGEGRQIVAERGEYLLKLATITIILLFLELVNKELSRIIENFTCNSYPELFIYIKRPVNRAKDITKN